MLARNVLIITGVLTLLAGLAISVLSFRQHQAALEGVPKPEVAHQSVLVAAHPIGTGSLLRPEDMVWKDMTASEVPPGSVVHNGAAETDFVGAVSRRDFQANEPLLASALVKPNNRGFLAVVLTPGNVAMSIGVDPPQSVGGLIMPGDHVDVLLSQTFGEQTTDTPHRNVGETILRDVRVIAVDQTLSVLARPAVADVRIGGAADPHIPRTITLDVTDRQAQVLAVASQLGKIGIAVRALGAADGGQPNQRIETPTWAADVSPALNSLMPNSLNPNFAGPGQGLVQSIEVMHGSKVERLCQRGANLVPCQ
jgi:pilus assembly protein CpaB